MTFKVLEQPHQADFQSAYNYLKGACDILVPALIKEQESALATMLKNAVAEAEKMKVTPSVTVDKPIYRHPTDAAQPRKGDY